MLKPRQACTTSDANGKPMSDERSLQGTQIPTKRRWIVFGLAAATSFILYLHRYTWNFIRPELMDEYKFSNQEMGVLDTAFYVSYSFGQIPGGIICDLFGPHLFVGIIIAIWSLTMPCLGLAGSMNGLIAARFRFRSCTGRLLSVSGESNSRMVSHRATNEYPGTCCQLFWAKWRGNFFAAVWFNSDGSLRVQLASGPHDARIAGVGFGRSFPVAMSKPSGRRPSV